MSAVKQKQIALSIVPAGFQRTIGLFSLSQGFRFKGHFCIRFREETNIWIAVVSGQALCLRQPFCLPPGRSVASKESLSRIEIRPTNSAPLRWPMPGRSGYSCHPNRSWPNRWAIALGPTPATDRAVLGIDAGEPSRKPSSANRRCRINQRRSEERHDEFRGVRLSAWLLHCTNN